MILKQNGEREQFDRTKLVRELVRACDRTEVLEPRIEELVSTVEAELQQRVNRDITSRDISELVLQNLRSLSEVAYIRYASLYCDFADVQGFIQALDALNSAPGDIALSQTA
jgi:transcriptional repressor NrdR